MVRGAAPCQILPCQMMIDPAGADRVTAREPSSASARVGCREIKELFPKLVCQVTCTYLIQREHRVAQFIEFPGIALQAEFIDLSHNTRCRIVLAV